MYVIAFAGVHDGRRQNAAGDRIGGVTASDGVSSVPAVDRVSAVTAMR